MSDSDDAERKTPSVPRYRNNYSTWITSFTVWATVQNCHTVLTTPRDLPDRDYYSLGVMDDMEGTNEEKKYKKDLLMKNVKLVSALYKAFAKNEAMERKVQLTINAINWPIGRAWLVMQKLEEVYRPRDNLTEVDAEQELKKIKQEDL